MKEPGKGKESAQQQPPAAPPAPARRSWAWLPEHMPQVARLIDERRALHGDAWVNECWRRGVLRMEPGFFFAMEGPVSVGVMWGDAQLVALASRHSIRSQALLILKDPPAQGTQQPQERAPC